MGACAVTSHTEHSQTSYGTNMELIMFPVEGRDKGRIGEGLQWGETFINTQQDSVGNTGHPQKQTRQMGGSVLV